MKNVERLENSVPVFRVPLHGAPPPRGWALQYVSGIDDDPTIKPGFWLTQWSSSSDGYVTFNFENEFVISFKDKSVAENISKSLRETTEIETKIVKMG